MTNPHPHPHPHPSPMDFAHEIHIRRMRILAGSVTSLVPGTLHHHWVKSSRACPAQHTSYYRSFWRQSS